jgi:peptide-methionine (S)-S-oxide reductase
LQVVEPRRLVFGAGCFWHVEAAFRRLPGVIDTKCGYAGGVLSKPTYEDVCKGDSGHAEVVSVFFDATILSPKVLVDAFLSLHDPTKVRAHGKHAIGTGQYRSCIFTSDNHLYNLANDSIEDCRVQLQKELRTETRIMEDDFQWFWEAEERHQRHDERKGRTALETLSFTDWLVTYNHRSASKLGSTESIEVSSPAT